MSLTAKDKLHDTLRSIAALPFLKEIHPSVECDDNFTLSDGELNIVWMGLCGIMLSDTDTVLTALARRDIDGLIAQFQKMMSMVAIPVPDGTYDVVLKGFASLDDEQRNTIWSLIDDLFKTLYLSVKQTGGLQSVLPTPEK